MLAVQGPHTAIARLFGPQVKHFDIRPHCEKCSWSEPEARYSRFTCSASSVALLLRGRYFGVWYVHLSGEMTQHGVVDIRAERLVARQTTLGPHRKKGPGNTLAGLCTSSHCCAVSTAGADCLAGTGGATSCSVRGDALNGQSPRDRRPQGTPKTLQDARRMGTSSCVPAVL